jgi:PadR family transcriptional regulator, regulatory protein PadR
VSAAGTIPLVWPHVLVWPYHMSDTTTRADLMQGTLDLMVLQTLHAMGPLHGYGLARRIEQLSDDALRLNQGTIYASLLRLSERGWITSAWGVSDNNRRAKFYSLSRSGRRQLDRETDSWKRSASVIGRLLRLSPGGR